MSSKPKLPAYFLPRPPAVDHAEALPAFDDLFDRATGDGAEVIYDLPWPRWRFICHIADTRGLILHGSQNSGIALFKPRKSHDAHPFGDREAVYGSSDGLWSMYYAILDRAKHPMGLVNAAFRVELADGGRSEPYYFFSISRTALEARPFSPGTIYFLPRAGFDPMPPMEMNGHTVHVEQWASVRPVEPLARIAVRPDDFPFLNQIRGHDDETVWASARVDPGGFPWLDQ
jgi:hypothetical protein